ncbi:hypothetical protein Tco_1425366, partial [Tanacetum coccineum]
LISLEMKETKAYKTYLGFATGATPPKKARNFKNPASLKLTTVPASTEELTGKSKRVKRHANKSTQALARGVVIRETPKMPVSKKKEKVDVTRSKEIKLLSDVALQEDAQFEEVRMKSMRDFHKTHPSGSGIVTKPTPMKLGLGEMMKMAAIMIKTPKVKEVIKIKTVTMTKLKDSDDDKTQSDSEDESDSVHDTDKNESDSESDQEEDDEKIDDDEEEEDEEIVKTPSNDSYDEDETKIADKAEGDEDEEMDYTTSLLYDDVDIRLNEPVDTDKGFVQEEGTNAKTKVPVSSSSHSSDLVAKYLNFSDIPTTKAEIVSPMDVLVHHEVPSQKTPTLLTVPVLVIIDSSPAFSIVIPQSFTPPPLLSTPTPPPTTEATNPPSTLPDFASVFQFNNRVTTLEKEVAELKKDPLHTQVTAIVDEHLDAKLGATRDEFMNFLSKSLTARITKQVKDQLPQILPEVVSNFAPPVIQKKVTESLEEAVLAKESSQPQSSYEAAATLTEFELKKILIDKIDKSQSYLTTSEYGECYDGLIKSYDLDKSLFSTYGNVYSLKRSQNDKDKDEDPSAGSDRGLKKRKTSKDAKPTKGPKAKESQSGSSKGIKSQPKSFGKFVQSEETEFEVTDSDMPQDQEENLGNDDVEPKEKVASKRVWFTKPTQPQEPTDPDWNVDKTPQQGQNQSWLMTLASSVEKLSKTFDDLMSTPIGFSAFIMNGLKINNLTQETLLVTAFRLLKGTRSNYDELQYDFEKCYKALLEKLDWENPEGGDYPFDLTKPLPLVVNGNRQVVPVDYFFNNDLKYQQRGILTMTYTTSITKTKAAQYDLPGIEDMVPNIWVPVKVAYDKHALCGISH